MCKASCIVCPGATGVQTLKLLIGADKRQQAPEDGNVMNLQMYTVKEVYPEVMN